MTRLFVFTSYEHSNFEILCSAHAVVSSNISSCPDSVVIYWMKAMTQTLPVATYTQMMNQTKHSDAVPVVPIAVNVVVRRNVSSTSLAPVLNFTVPEQ